MAMSLVSGERAAATTARLVRLVFFMSDWTTAACGTFPPFRAKFGMVRYWGQIDRAEAVGMTRRGGP